MAKTVEDRKGLMEWWTPGLMVGPGRCRWMLVCIPEAGGFDWVSVCIEWSVFIEWLKLVEIG